MESGNDTFSMFTPISLIKGTDALGKTVMRMEGIASTSSKDADGEFLDPNGFELDYFMKYGFMNWNHQTSKDPLALIGRPTKAINKSEGLFIGCELFDNSPRAKEVYALGEILEAQGIPLGFSIEGKVIERDAKNPKIVKKAKITGCAITPNPKNTDTVAIIIKGHNFNTLNSQEDEEDQEKAMSVDSLSGKALAKESLDGNVKNLTNNNKKKKKKKFTKGEVMSQIFEKHPELPLETGEHLFKLISKIEKSIIMKKTDINISPEAIEKAYATLGFKKDDTSSKETEDEGMSDLEKGYVELSKQIGSGDYQKMSKAEKADLKKKMSDTLAKMEDDEEEDEDDDEKDSKKDPKKKTSKKEDDSSDEEDGEMKKGISVEAIEAATLVLKAAGIKFILGEEITKGEDLKPLIESDSGEISDLIKSEFENISLENDLKWKATTTLIKGLSEEVGSLKLELEQIGSTSIGRKSVTQVSAIEKAWDADLEKGLSSEKGGLKKLSKTRDKQTILNMLEETYFEKGELVNPKLGNDTAIFESSDQLSKAIIDTMKDKGFEIVG